MTNYGDNLADVTAATSEEGALTKLVRFILGRPYWAFWGPALALATVALILHAAFAAEASRYTRLAHQPLPPAMSIDAYRLPKDGPPHEAQLKLELMLSDQTRFAVTQGGAPSAALYFLPFTAPPGAPGAGKVLGGFMLSQQDRDTFVRWAVDRAGQRLTRYGIALTVAGLVERPPGAEMALAAMREAGLPVSNTPIFMVPYAGQRAQVLAARAQWVRSNPLQRILLIAAAVAFLLGLSRYAALRKQRRNEPEPLSVSKLRDTRFEHLGYPAGSAEAGATAPAGVGAELRPEPEVQDRPQVQQNKPLAGARGWQWFAMAGGLWLSGTAVGWELSRLFPGLLGGSLLIAGLLVVPLAGLVRLLSGWGLSRGARASRRRNDPFERLHKSVTTTKLRARAGGRP